MGSSMIVERTGVVLGEPQVHVLETARSTQFFVVYPGRSATRANHVMVGIVNKGRKFLYDPQSGARTVLDESSRFIAFPIRLP